MILFGASGLGLFFWLMRTLFRGHAIIQITSAAGTKMSLRLFFSALVS